MLEAANPLIKADNDSFYASLFERSFNYTTLWCRNPGIWTVEQRSWKLAKIANANNGDGGNTGADEKKAADNPLFDNEAANSYGGGGERRTGRL